MGAGMGHMRPSPEGPQWSPPHPVAPLPSLTSIIVRCTSLSPALPRREQMDRWAGRSSIEGGTRQPEARLQY